MNKRMSASLAATSASFQMDAKALGQVEFIKKLVNQDSERTLRGLSDRVDLVG